VAYVGTTDFKEGDWVGIILDTAEGKNNGSVEGRVYFVTEEKRGVFCRPSKVTPAQMSEADANAFSAQQEAKYARLAASSVTIPPSNTATSAGTVMTSKSEGNNGLKLGDRVVINNADGSFKLGTLRYIGPAEFVKGDEREWAGVELDERLGKNNGTVEGKEYFKCEPMHGVFTPLLKLEVYNEAVHARG
jgi:dynactin complex subunit